MRAGTIVAGVFLIVVGFLLDLTIIGLIIGIPIGLIGLLVLIVGLVTSHNSTIVQVYNNPLMSANESSRVASVRSEENDARENLRILKRRLANGEITKTQYNKLKIEFEKDIVATSVEKIQTSQHNILAIAALIAILTVFTFLLLYLGMLSFSVILVLIIAVIFLFWYYKIK